MRSKIKAWASAATVAALTFPALALGQWDPGANIPGNTNLVEDDFTTILGRVLNYLLAILAVMAVIGFVVAGIMYLTAAGDETRVDNAKKMLTYSIVGVVVALLGLVIINTIQFILNG